MSLPKKIQIDYNLFIAISDYIDRHPDWNDQDYRYITSGIDTKLKAINQRILYTAYKTAETKDIRATAREMYLDNLGMSDSFRWSNEQDGNVMHRYEDEYM